MFNVFQKVGAVALTGAMVFTTGCSFGFGGSKPNTMEPEKILELAKKEIFESLKVSTKNNLKKYEENYMKTFTDWPNGGTSKFTVNIDAGDSGKGEVEVSADSKMDNSKLKKLTKSSTLMDLLKAPEGKGDYEVKVKANVPPLSEIEASVKFSIMMDGGVYYVKLVSVDLSDDLPGVITKDSIASAISSFKGTWYKVDLVKLIESNPIIVKVLEKKLGDLNNVDAEKMSKLFAAYIDDVVMKEDWLSVDKGSKTEVDAGDKYKVTLTSDKAKKFFEMSYDFFVDNLDDIDSILDLTQSKNPLVPSSVLTVDMIRKEIKSSKASFLKDLESDLSDDLDFQVTFAGDKLAVFGFEYVIPEKEDAEGKIAIALNFEDGKNDFEFSNVDVNLDIKGKNKDEYLKGTMKLSEADGSNRVSRGNIEFSFEKGLVFKAKFDAAVETESKNIKSFNADFDLESDKEIEDNLKGAKGEVKFVGGKNKTLKMTVKSVPDAKFFNISVDGKFGKEKGSAKAEFAVNPEKNVNLKGAAGLEYDLETANVDFSLPSDASDAQDYTPVLLQLISGAMGAPGLAGPEYPTDVMMGGSSDSAEMSDEDIQAMMKSYR